MCLFNRHSSSASSSVSDTRVGLKDFICVKKISIPIKSKLDEYLADALDEAIFDSDFDILVWLKLKASEYSIVARLIQDILVVLISTAASESTFSTSGRTLNTVRNSLNGESIEPLVCAQNWLQASVTDMCFICSCSFALTVLSVTLTVFMFVCVMC
jgi:hAT family C-terminal dimerisation region